MVVRNSNDDVVVLDTDSPAGEYTITATLTGDDAAKYTAVYTYVITPKAVGVFVAPTTRGTLTYDPSSADPQALINAGSSEHGTIKYKIGAGEYSTTIPAQRNANVDGYDVYYKLFGDSNHEGSEENLINVVINKLEVAVEWSGTTVVYAGANVEPDDPVATITNNNSEDVNFNSNLTARLATMAKSRMSTTASLPSANTLSQSILQQAQTILQAPQLSRL